jgi:hypothetical protein
MIRQWPDRDLIVPPSLRYESGSGRVRRLAEIAQGLRLEQARERVRPILASFGSVPIGN